MNTELVFRILFVAILTKALAVSVYYRRRARREGTPVERAAEPRSLILLRAAVALPLWSLFLLQAAYPPAVSWGRVEIPVAARLLAAGLAGATIPFLVWMFRSLGSNVSETVLTREGQELVTGGPYRWIRHPLYTGGIVLLAALGVTAANWALVLAPLVVAAFLPGLVRREEAELLERFGTEYERYMERTGRFLPRFGDPSERSSG